MLLHLSVINHYFVRERSGDWLKHVLFPLAGLLIIVYALIGFAVIHTLTSALKYRGIWLCCSYAIMTVTVWPILAVVLLGLADSLFGLRRRYLRPRPPPLSVS